VANGVPALLEAGRDFVGLQAPEPKMMQSGLKYTPPHRPSSVSGVRRTSAQASFKGDYGSGENYSGDEDIHLKEQRRQSDPLGARGSSTRGPQYQKLYSWLYSHVLETLADPMTWNGYGDLDAVLKLSVERFDNMLSDIRATAVEQQKFREVWGYYEKIKEKQLYDWLFGHYLEKLFDTMSLYNYKDLEKILNMTVKEFDVMLEDIVATSWEQIKFREVWRYNEKKLKEWLYDKYLEHLFDKMSLYNYKDLENILKMTVKEFDDMLCIIGANQNQVILFKSAWGYHDRVKKNTLKEWLDNKFLGFFYDGIQEKGYHDFCTFWNMSLKDFDALLEWLSAGPLYATLQEKENLRVAWEYDSKKSDVAIGLRLL